MHNIKNYCTKKGSITLFLLGIAFTVSLTEVAIPRAQAEWSNLVAKMNPAVEYHREEGTATTTEVANNPERLEKYYQEEYEALKEKYQNAHENAARTKAIDRVQADLEEEKQKLRESELLL